MKNLAANPTILTTLAQNSGTLELLKDAVENGEDPNEADGFGYNALMWALLNRDIEKVMYLREVTDCKRTTPKGSTPLMFAVKTQESVFVEALLSKSNPNERDSDGMTALMYAALNGCNDIVELLKNETDANIKDDQGMTALMCATRKGNFEAARSLIEVSDLSLRDVYGLSASQSAAAQGGLDIVLELMSNKDDEDEMKEILDVAQRFKNSALINLLKGYRMAQSEKGEFNECASEAERRVRRKL